ncbi:50S ribosomal protein L29 [Desulfococcaceae bacterium HSG9]|nr:50S ribosomal protein L29 [Desulfococcaceae bacterium HSG9]
MKADAIRELTIEEMRQKISDKNEELLNLRFQNTIGQVENPQRIKIVRRTIARIKTILNQNITETA